MQDFLEYLYETYGYDHKFIRQIASGERYFAVELINGNIGVCATLGEKYDDQIPGEIYPEVYRHRVLLTAYYNALLNYRVTEIHENKDITDLDLKKYRHVVFVGKFDPVFEKLREQGISFEYIDLRAIDDPDNQLDNKEKVLSRADLLVISATAITNGSLNELIETSPYSEKYILGPSSVLTPDLARWGIKASFGVQFKPYDSRVLGVIAQNYGTRYFLHKGKKVMVRCESTETK